MFTSRRTPIGNPGAVAARARLDRGASLCHHRWHLLPRLTRGLSVEERLARDGGEEVDLNRLLQRHGSAERSWITAVRSLVEQLRDERDLRARRDSGWCGDANPEEMVRRHHAGEWPQRRELQDRRTLTQAARTLRLRSGRR